MDISEKERLNIVMDAYLKMQPESRSDMFARTHDMSKLTDQDKFTFGILKQMEEEIEKENIVKIKKVVSEITEKRIAEKEEQAQRMKRAEEKRVSEIPLPGLEDLSKSSSRGGRKKNNKTKKHKK